MEICHCWRLKRAAHHLNEFYDKALAPSGVTISQYGMLREINQHGGCSVMDLAGYLDLERSTLTRSLKPLMQKGFVSDCRECHMRNCRLVLTRPLKRPICFGKKPRLLMKRPWEQRV